MDEEKRKKQAHIIALLLTVAIVIFGFVYVLHYVGHEATQEKPAVMKQEQTQNMAALRNQLDIQE